jgi:hypothetical protein
MPVHSVGHAQKGTFLPPLRGIFDQGHFGAKIQPSYFKFNKDAKVV